MIRSIRQPAAGIPHQGEELWAAAQRTVDWCLAAQLLKHFGRSSQSITRFSDRDIEDEFLDAELAHGVRALIFAGVRLARRIISIVSIREDSRERPLTIVTVYRDRCRR